MDFYELFIFHDLLNCKNGLKTLNIMYVSYKYIFELYSFQTQIYKILY